MKKFTIILAMFITIIFGVTLSTVYARSEDSNLKSNKTKISCKGQDLYVSVEAHFNMSSTGYAQKAVIIKNVQARYDEGKDTFYINVKRSDVNAAFTEKYDNVYTYLQFNVDMHDISSDYYRLNQPGPIDEVAEYTYTPVTSERVYLDYGYIELFTGTIPLSGIVGNSQTSIGGGIMIFKGATELYKGYPEKYTKSEISRDGLVLELTKIKTVVSITEDVKANLGENTKVISGNSNFETGKLEEETLDNFYVNYDETKRENYTCTFTDENGNPLDIGFDTSVTIDDSEYDDEIYNCFAVGEDNILDTIKADVKILSFNHEGDLGGVAEFKVYVGDKYKAGENLQLYYYNVELDALETITLGLEDGQSSYVVDSDGYVTFKITHCSEYVLAPTTLKVADSKTVVKALDTNVTPVLDINKTQKVDNKLIWIISISGALVLIATAVTVIVIIKRKKSKSKKVNEETEATKDTNNDI